jgi:DNA-binding beta-propeller fold protein YncE
VVNTIVPGTQINGVVVNPSTNRIYATASNQVYVIDGFTNSIIATIPVPGTSLSSHIVVNDQTNIVYIAAQSILAPQGGFIAQGGVYVINGSNNTIKTQINAGNYDYCCGLAVNPNMNMVYISNSTATYVVNGETNRIIASLNVDGIPIADTSIDVNPNTNRVYVLDYRGVNVFDGTTDALIVTIPIQRPPVNSIYESLAVDADANRVFVAIGPYDFNSSCACDSVKEINGSSNTVTATIPVKNTTFSMAVNPSTGRVYLPMRASQGGLLGIIDGSSESLACELPISTEVFTVAVDPSTNLIYLGGESGIPVVSDPSTSPNSVCSSSLSSTISASSSSSSNSSSAQKEVQYSINLQAWIPQAEVVDPANPFATGLPYAAADVVEPQCYTPPSILQPIISVTSAYVGDNHEQFDGGHRILTSVEFDWSRNGISNFEQSTSVGTSVREMNYSFLGSPIPLVMCEITRTAIPTVVAEATGPNSFTIQYTVANPLVTLLGDTQSVAPPVTATITGTFSPDGTLSISFTAFTLFPSQGVSVSANGVAEVTDILNDVSCLSNSQVLYWTGFGYLTYGLKTTGTSGSFTVFPSESGINLDSPSALCS